MRDLFEGIEGIASGVVSQRVGGLSKRSICECVVIGMMGSVSALYIPSAAMPACTAHYRMAYPLQEMANESEYLLILLLSSASL